MTTSPATHIYVSQAGLEKLRAELERAEENYRRTCEESATAYALSGDGWHDNPYLNHTQQHEAALNREVARLRDLNRRAVVLERGGGPGSSQVTLGCTVSLLVTDAESQRQERQRWMIVGYGEGDRAARRLAYSSPMAAAVMGRAVGDVVEVTIAGRELEVRVEDVVDAAA